MRTDTSDRLQTLQKKIISSKQEDLIPQERAMKGKDTSGVPEQRATGQVPLNCASSEQENNLSLVSSIIKEKDNSVSDSSTNRSKLKNLQVT